MKPRIFLKETKDRMSDYRSDHITPERLQDIGDGKTDLSRKEFEHIHVCPDCLQAYAEAVRERAKKRKPGSSDSSAFGVAELALRIT